MLPGRYRVERELGRGGMGRVFVARDEKLDREVAIKVLAAGRVGEDAVRRFEQEARAAARLEHPNVIAVYDVGQSESGPYIVSEVLHGDTLRERIGHGLPPLEDALDWATQLAHGLSAAHDKGVVHRDLKPENLFITRDGRLKILDFGIAKLAEPPDEPSLTATGAILGTVGYMAPEQVRGESVDARSDIFSFGSVLHEMLSGAAPFTRASAMAAGMAIVSEAPPDLPGEVPHDVCRIVQRCLEKRREDRYASAHELAADLGRAAAAQAARASGNRLRLVAGALATATVLAAISLLVSRRSSAPAAPATPVSGPSIAVLPFSDLSPERNQEYFSDGIAEEILNELTHVDGLRVAGRTSSFSFRGKSEDLASIAAKLHVAAVLEGSVRKSGNRVRIAAQLINAQDGFRLWSKEYDRELTDIFRVQDELAASVVEALKVKLLPGATAVSRTRPPRDSEAYRLALLGRSLLLQQSDDSLRRAEDVLEKAVAIEPTYGKAWAWLAAVRGNIALVADRDQLEPRARAALEAADRAIAADPDDASDYGGRAWIRSHLFWDWSSARDDIDRALKLGPQFPDVLNAHSTLLQKFGHLEEAIAAERTLAAVDPIDVYAWTNLGALLADDGQLQAARESYARSLEISPDNSAAAAGIALIELLDRRPAQALAQVPKIRRQMDRLAFTAMANHDLGKSAEAQEALESLRAMARGPQGDVAYATASVYAWWGQRDLALQWLEEAWARHDLRLRFLKVDPLLRAVRADPRYQGLVRKLNLPVD